ncbi:MAG: OmpA family protein, partial [Candidatus Kapabacteria bacterium]|nr:OmpA family protein [Candidatus Kapabacteria bacterium]
MNLNKISTKLILFLLFIISISCSANKQIQKIKIDSFSNDITINEGDSALVKWQFKNIDCAYFEGIPRTFKAVDSVYLSPMDDTTYKLIAVNPIDTQKLDIHIFVNHPVKEIQTGAEIIQKKFNEPSLEVSDYLNGLLPSTVRYNLKNIKIIRTDFEDNKMTLSLLPMDEFGNFITNLNLDSLNLSIDVNSYGMRMSFNQKFVGEKRLSDTANPISVHILLENSLAAYELDKVSEQIRTALRNFDNFDRVSFGTFNQNLEMHFENEVPRKAYVNFSTIDIKPSGTAAYSTAIISTLKKIRDTNVNKNDIIILLAYSEENSSIISTLDEAIKIACSMHIPIYIITLSNDYKSYQMNTIADATGGRLYSLESNEFDKISKVISEIYFGQKVFYQYNLTFLNELKYYPELLIKSALYINQKFIDDARKFYLQVPEIYIPYQILTIFDYTSNKVPQSYYKKLGELANLLKNNSKSMIEISAYSYFEIDSAKDYDLSLERAQNIRQILIDSGAQPEQIRLKARGNENPLYYLPIKEWQLSYNRRAEVRWLDPELLPYEILAQIVASESDALTKVTNWEKLGFRAYYQRYIINNEIKYQ